MARERLMIRHGVAPYLECSSRGFRPFSAFHARVHRRDGRSIEAIYQGAKIFRNGDTGLDWRDAKGFRPVNADECRTLYATLWDEYIEDNPGLHPILMKATGLSDMFGKRGSCCQATELWRIREGLLARLS